MACSLFIPIVAASDTTFSILAPFHSVCLCLYPLLEYMPTYLTILKVHNPWFHNRWMLDISVNVSGHIPTFSLFKSPFSIHHKTVIIVFEKHVYESTVLFIFSSPKFIWHIICMEPIPFSVKTTLIYDTMDMRIPFHISTIGLQNLDHPYLSKYPGLWKPHACETYDEFHLPIGLLPLCRRMCIIDICRWRWHILSFHTQDIYRFYSRFWGFCIFSAFRYFDFDWSDWIFVPDFTSRALHEKSIIAIVTVIVTDLLAFVFRDTKRMKVRNIKYSE